ncbi:hypothetical protein P154DRAFT_13295 [Amniculicola lignicola CBS 123094]|uniref:Secreted protein n=1 Tax=Amniculicola lignicola CBS 123094 TaxID=1392246 RepID=A0A6A5X566_9PLEO|nr:hypothetical protein P154DRAFT_13295 [Amniculicola lignicola CBS 123094]
MPLASNSLFALRLPLFFLWRDIPASITISTVRNIHQIVLVPFVCCKLPSSTLLVAKFARLAVCSVVVRVEYSISSYFLSLQRQSHYAMTPHAIPTLPRGCAVAKMSGLRPVPWLPLEEATQALPTSKTSSAVYFTCPGFGSRLCPFRNLKFVSQRRCLDSACSRDC